ARQGPGVHAASSSAPGAGLSFWAWRPFGPAPVRGRSQGLSCRPITLAGEVVWPAADHPPESLGDSHSSGQVLVHSQGVAPQNDAADAYCPITAPAIGHEDDPGDGVNGTACDHGNGGVTGRAEHQFRLIFGSGV